MRKLFLCAMLWLIAIPGATGLAQDSPTYTVFSTAPILTDDGTLEMELSVFNGGGAATAPATIELNVFGDDTPLADTQVDPLGASESTTATLAFPLTALAGTPPGDLVVLQIAVRSEEFDRIQRLIEFNMPQQATPSPTPLPATPDPIAPGPAFDLEPIRVQAEAWLAFLPFEVDLSDRVQLAVLLGVLMAGILLLWLTTVILRLLFTPQPRYPNHPPPYVNTPRQDANTIGGRRQMWQYVAQNGSMLVDETDGNLHIRKILIGTDGQRFSGWRVVGVRASQYDTYGRVSRTEIIGPRAMVRKLTRLIEQAESLSFKQVQRRVKPVAHQLARGLSRRITRKGAGLPIALDVKFRGEHGEVEIRFILYQYQGGAWQQLDSWPPEMTVHGKAIYESYTYTVFGRREGESMRGFRRRLRADLTFLLTEMALCTPPQLETEAQHPPTNPAHPTPTHDGQWQAPTTSTQHPTAPPSEDTVPGEPAWSVEDTPAHQGDTPLPNDPEPGE